VPLLAAGAAVRLGELDEFCVPIGVADQVGHPFDDLAMPIGPSADDNAARPELVIDGLEFWPCLLAAMAESDSCIVRVSRW
jgi:hypothetical protein